MSVWRQGRRVGHHVYRQTGVEPSDGDRWVGSFRDPTDAALACRAVNALPVVSWCPRCAGRLEWPLIEIPAGPVPCPDCGTDVTHPEAVT